MSILWAELGKKCLSEPAALFWVSRSRRVMGMLPALNHSASRVMTMVLPTPPLPPMEKMTRLEGSLDWFEPRLTSCVEAIGLVLSVGNKGQGLSFDVFKAWF